MIKSFILSFTVIILFSCNNNPKSPEAPSSDSTSGIPAINYTVVKYFPHDTSLFIEGFLIHGGELFESTGSPPELPNTRSLVGISDLSTGKFSKKIELDKTKYFGEGIIFFKDRLYQLTYKNKTCFIYDTNSYKQIDSFKYANAEGWSLTTDGTSLIMSDGTNILTFLNPANGEPVKILAVTENGMAVDKLNELEFIKGFIYANIWTTSYIVKIDPSNGKVVGKLDLSSLSLEAGNKNQNAQVMNGIAYDSAADKIYITGKFWPNIYQINFVH
jgi:glutamine cyclotransferase